MEQSIYIEYQYYLHQAAAIPILKHWFKQKMLTLISEADHPGPRPGGSYDRRGAYGGRGSGLGGYRFQVQDRKAAPVAQAAAVAPSASVPSCSIVALSLVIPSPPLVVQIITSNCSDHSLITSLSMEDE